MLRTVYECDSCGKEFRREDQVITCQQVFKCLPRSGSVVVHFCSGDCIEQWYADRQLRGDFV